MIPSRRWCPSAAASLTLLIGESYPEGCVACDMVTNPSNAYRNGTMYSSYTAASLAPQYTLVTLHNFFRLML